MNPQIAFMRLDLLNFFLRLVFALFSRVYVFTLSCNSFIFSTKKNVYRGILKVKGSLSAAQKFTPDIFPKMPVSKL